MANADTVTTCSWRRLRDISLHRCDMPIPSAATRRSDRVRDGLGPAGEILRLAGDRAAHLHAPSTTRCARGSGSSPRRRRLARVDVDRDRDGVGGRRRRAERTRPVPGRRGRGGAPRRAGGAVRRGPRAAMEASAAVVARLAASDEPVYGVSTGFGSLATRRDPAPSGARSCSARWSARTPPGMGAAGRARGRAGDDAAARADARDGPLGRAAGRRRDDARAARTPGSTPVVPEHGSLGASGDLAPLAHCALALIGEGEVADGAGALRPAAEALRGRRDRAARAQRQGGAGADQRHRRDARHAGARAARPARAAARRRRRRGDVGRGAARHRPRVRRRPDRAAPAARPGRQRGEPARAAGRLADRRQPPPRRPARAGRLLAALRAAGARRRARHARPTPSAWRPPSCASAIDNPMVLPDGRVESCGNFHGAPLAFACDFLAIAVAEVGAIAERRTDRLLDASRSHGPAAVPRRGRGRQLGADDRPVHAGGDGGREPAARRAGERRLAADQRDAGGPRVDGLGRRAQAARGASPTCARILAVELACAGARPRPARAAASPAPGHAAPRWRRCASASPGPGPTAGWRPTSPRPRSWCASGALLDAVEAAIGELRDEPGAARSARRAAPSCRARAGRRRPRCGCS